MTINPALCPTCSQPWPNRQGRICSQCGLKIGRHDKYRFVGAALQHRDCANPEMRTTLEAPQPNLLGDAR
jgi:predicted amidophosphoribosyltransferase